MDSECYTNNTNQNFTDIINKKLFLISESNEKHIGEFNEKYNEKFKDKYLKRKFFKNHEYVFMIEKDFPRIREKDLAELKRIGILKGSYEISLATCETYKISMDKFIKSL